MEMFFYHKLGSFFPVLSGLVLPEPLATSREFNYNKPPRNIPTPSAFGIREAREAAAHKSEGEAAGTPLIFPVQALTCGN